MHSGMRILFISAFMLLMAVLFWANTGEDTFLLRYPDVSDNAIVFVYGGNLWKVGLKGGTAQKLTSHDGYEIYPKFSPDGRWIAFSGQYDGNTDLFVIPSDGGIPRRLTYHPDSDRVVDWYPTGNRILFLSRRASWKERFQRYFSVSLKGGQPKMLSLPKGGLASFSPDGHSIAYNRISRETRHWKRYRGGMAQDVWIYNFQQNRIRRITRFPGTDNFPMWYKNRIYFISDRSHTTNIFYYDMKKKKIVQVTHHKDYDVEWPSIGSHYIVYQNGGALWLLDLKSGKYRPVHIYVPDDGIYVRPHFMKVDKYIHGGSISPTGKRAAFNARGDIFTVPAKKGNTRNITNTPGVREKDPVWSPNGEWIAYYSDKTGEYEIYLRRSDGEGEEKRITSDGSCFRYPLKWSPDSKKLLFADSKLNFYYIDIEKKIPVRFDHDPYAHSPGDYRWSGDSNWVVYSKASALHTSSIFIYSLENKSIHRLTTDDANDYDPVFSRDGKYLFFISQRSFQPTFSDFDNSYVYKKAGRIYYLTLQKDTNSLLAPESDEEKMPEGEGEGKVEKQKKNLEKVNIHEKKENNEKHLKEKAEIKGKKKEAKKWKIDFDSIASRVEVLPMRRGRYSSLQTNKGNLFYIEYSDETGRRGGVIKAYNFKKRKAINILPGVFGYELSFDGKKILYNSMGKFGIINAMPGSKPGTGVIKTSQMHMLVDPRAEWKQIFNDAWRQERDFFYDPNMHGVDWKAMKVRYGRLLPWCAHRDDLNYLIGELIAELDCSHTYVFGGDMPKVPKVSIGLLGVDLSIDKEHKLYRIKKIFRGESWDRRRIAPLNKPGLKVKEGDYILAVNGRNVQWPDNFYSYFQDTVGKQVKLKINSKPTLKDAWEIVVKPIANDLQLRYIDRVKTNREYVNKSTGGKVGYIHVPSTGVDGLNEFYRGYISQFDKEGLIIDVRYNNGGMIPDRFIEVLRRPLMNYWATQQSKGMTTPTYPTPPHLVCIINAYAGSGGDAFPYYFKLFKLGPLVGKRTWGGLVGISRTIPFVDNGVITMPDFGIYSKEGKWAVENHGVDPDIEVDNRPDLVIGGHDPQLEKAIQEIEREIKLHPKKRPHKPKYPVKK